MTGTRGPPPDFANPAFLQGRQVGTLSATDVNEASGIAASRQNKDVFWIHNDSGGGYYIYAINRTGKLLGTYLVGPTTGGDQEDIAIGPGPISGKDYIYWADTGDNNNVRSDISVLRIPEPVVKWNQSHESKTLTGVEWLYVQYPTDSTAPSHKDCETLLVDTNGDIIMVTKRTSVGRIYMAPYPQSNSSTNNLVYMGSLSWGGWITGGDMSPDGSLIALRQTTGLNPEATVYYKGPGVNVSTALAGTRYDVDLQSEAQGEAICWDVNGRGFYTISEQGGGPTSIPLWYYQRNVFVHSPQVLGVSVVSRSSLALSWTRGVNATHTLVERNTLPSWSFGQGIAVYNGTNTSFNDTGLAFDTTYHYRAWSYDSFETLWNLTPAYGSNKTLANLHPILSDPRPSQGELEVRIMPAISINASDPEGDPMDVAFWTNASGAWAQFGSNLSISNGTFSQPGTPFAYGNTRYWWSVNCTDGYDWTNTTYAFRTRETDRPYVVQVLTSKPSPLNASTYYMHVYFNEAMDITVDPDVWLIRQSLPESGPPHCRVGTRTIRYEAFPIGWISPYLWNGTFMVLTDTTNGNYAVNITNATDIVGNLQVPDSDLILMIDTLSPHSEIKAPHISNNRTFIINVSGYDMWLCGYPAPSGIARIDLYYRSPMMASFALLGIYPDSQNITFTAHYDGMYDFYCLATDLAGNHEEREMIYWTTLVDTVRPEVEIQFEKPGPYNSDFNIELNFSEPVDPYLLNATCGIAPFYDQYLIEGQWYDVLTWRGSVLFPSEIPDGTYILSVNGTTDPAGNLLWPRLSTPFVIDTTGPAIVNLTLDKPQPLGPGQVNFTVTFDGPVDMEVPLVFELDLNKHGRYTTEILPVNVGGDWLDNRTWRGTRIILPEVETGEYPIAIYGAVDLLGNPMMKNTSFSVLINTTQPTNNTNVTDDDIVVPDDDVIPPDDDDIIPDNNGTSDDKFEWRTILIFVTIFLIIIMVGVIAAVAYRRQQRRTEKEYATVRQEPQDTGPSDTSPDAKDSEALLKNHANDAPSDVSMAPTPEDPVSDPGENMGEAPIPDKPPELGDAPQEPPLQDTTDTPLATQTPEQQPSASQKL